VKKEVTKLGAFRALLKARLKKLLPDQILEAIAVVLEAITAVAIPIKLPERQAP